MGVKVIHTCDQCEVLMPRGYDAFHARIAVPTEQGKPPRAAYQAVLCSLRCLRIWTAGVADQIEAEETE